MLRKIFHGCTTLRQSPLAHYVPDPAIFYHWDLCALDDEANHSSSPVAARLPVEGRVQGLVSKHHSPLDRHTPGIVQAPNHRGPAQRFVPFLLQSAPLYQSIQQLRRRRRLGRLAYKKNFLRWDIVILSSVSICAGSATNDQAPRSAPKIQAASLPMIKAALVQSPLSVSASSSDSPLYPSPPHNRCHNSIYAGCYTRCATRRRILMENDRIWSVKNVT